MKSLLFLLLGVFLAAVARAQIEGESAAGLIKRAELGDAVSRVKLSLIRSGGDNQLASEIQAARWYHEAVEQRNIASQYNLGLMFESGVGSAKDAAEASRWYRKAAELGNYAAQ